MADRDEVAFPGFRDIAERHRRALVRDLAERREALGLSQATVAARMGTSQSAVARMEGGGVDVRLSTVDRYAAALGLQARLGLTTPDDPGEGGHGAG